MKKLSLSLISMFFITNIQSNGFELNKAVYARTAILSDNGDVKQDYPEPEKEDYVKAIDTDFPELEVRQVFHKKCFFKKGLTWAFKKHDCKLYIDLVGCHGDPLTGSGAKSCDPYCGDTQCYWKLPILCINKYMFMHRPPYQPDLCIGCSMMNEFYFGWTGGIIRLTPPIRGCDL